jgi:hypothetical protein
VVSALADLVEGVAARRCRGDLRFEKIVDSLASKKQ